MVPQQKRDCQASLDAAAVHEVDILHLAPDGIVENINLKEEIKTSHKDSVANTIT